jgi:hypothetical protein
MKILDQCKGLNLVAGAAQITKEFIKRSSLANNCIAIILSMGLLVKLQN